MHLACGEGVEHWCGNDEILRQYAGERHAEQFRQRMITEERGAHVLVITHSRAVSHC